MTNAQAAIDFFNSDGPFLITTHIHADGDGIGAMLALSHWLDKIGRRYHIVIDDETPDVKYRFLPGFDRIASCAAGAAPAARAVILDTPTMSSKRIGNAANLLTENTQTLVIDHHAGETEEGTVRFVDPGASATCELVYHLIKASRKKLTRDMATCLYTGIAFDTKLFKHSHPDRALFVCADLAIKGADPQQIAEDLFSHQTYETVKTLGLALSSMALHAEGRISTLHVDHNTYQMGGDLDVVVDQAMSIDGVEVALFFKEEKPGQQRVSLRSRGQVDVNEVARAFGGGGHQRASGCTMEGPLHDARHRLISEVGKHLG